MIGRKFVAGRKGMVGLVAFACAMAMGLSGCSLTTPTRAEVEPEPVKATLGAEDLIEDGVLTVAMDMSDAPQAMTDQEGKPSGYYADIARLLAERMGLDLRVVSSADATGSLSKGKAALYRRPYRRGRCRRERRPGTKRLLHLCQVGRWFA